MSQQVANISLAGATVGQKGVLVSFKNLLPPPTLAQQMRPQDGNTASHLLIFNETGCLLTITLVESRQTKTLPAGRWLDLMVPPHETEIDYQVLGVASGFFNNLLADFFFPGEPVDALGVLGNSPVGVNTTTTQQLINTQLASGGQLVVDMDAPSPAHPWPANLHNVNWLNDGSLNINIRHNAQIFTPIIIQDGGTSGAATAQFGDASHTRPAQFYGQHAAVASIGGASSEQTTGMGVPAIVAAANATSITVTTGVNIIDFVTTSAGLYRITAYFRMNNVTSPQAIIVFLSWTDPAGTAGSYDVIFTSGAGVQTVADGAHNFANGLYMSSPLLLSAQASSHITLIYRDQAGTPNDQASAILERVA